MELTRRDVLAALAAAGVAGGAAALGLTLTEDDGIDEHDVDTLIAVAQTVYPSAVDGIPEFVEQYSVARVRDRPEYAAGIHDAVATLDEYANSWFDADFADLSREDRDTLLDQMSVDTASPKPDGDDAPRVRYYLVNELFYALFTTPTGGKLAGIENPPGHPGGHQSYQRGPRR